jgi:hypothetical protein
MMHRQSAVRVRGDRILLPLICAQRFRRIPQYAAVFTKPPLAADALLPVRISR